MSTPRTDDRGVEYVENATYEDLQTLPLGWALCNTCHRAWNDDKSTSVTPAPSGRCPFEWEHEYPEDDDAKQVTAVAHVVNHRSGRKIDLIGSGPSRKQARYRALALIREGEELVEVSYEEES